MENNKQSLLNMFFEKLQEITDSEFSNKAFIQIFKSRQARIFNLQKLLP